VIAWWIERQIASVLRSRVQTLASLKLGLVAWSCNTMTSGQEYLDVDGVPSLMYLLEGWFWSRIKANSEKKVPSMKLSPTVGLAW
jgi:hypothetical protein